MKNTRSKLACLGLMIALSNLGFAQETAATSERSADETNKAMNDPTQPIKSLIFFDQLTVNHYGRSGSSNQIVFQPVVPFTFAKHTNLLRFTLPYGTGGVGDKGLAPMQIFNLTMFKVGGGQLGVGPILSFNPNWKGLPSEDRIQAGVSWAFIRPSGQWTFGVLQQNLLSPNVQISAFQPVLAYAFPKGYSLSAGTQTWAFNWSEGGGLRTIPLGMFFSKLVTFPGNQMVKMGVNPEYNAKAVPGSAHWTVRFYVILLVR